MCGIVGYVGNRDIESVLIVGLERLSYRGYDSAGIAVVSEGEISVWKRTGKVHVLAKDLEVLNIDASVGIGHTRWATHGIANDVNAHPHVNTSKQFSIVHNGIIENYLTLKSELKQEGYLFRSQTDSEVIVHLIEKYFDGCIIRAVKQCVQRLTGAFSFCVISANFPEELIAVRKNSPLIIGCGNGEQFIASDVHALIPHTKKVIYMEENQIACIKKDDISLSDFDGNDQTIKFNEVLWDPEISEKNEYQHFMKKEIFEQPKIVKQILNMCLKEKKICFSNLNESKIDFKDVSRFIIQACGTSWHAGLVGKYLIEDLARIPTEVDISSEFRYRRLLNNSNEIVVAVSQSGETADTLACIREAKSKFFEVLSFVNVKGSSIDRESDAVIYTNSGPEIGVASTKNYIAQIMNMVLFGLYLGQERQILSQEKIQLYVNAMHQLPTLVTQVLELDAQIERLADRFSNSKSFLFIGRGLNFPTALEGALKLKEISYIHATGYAAGELKHGPIALIDDELPVVCLAPQSQNYEKMMSNIQEVNARGGQLIIIGTQGDTQLKEFSDNVIYIPHTINELTPILSVIPLQLLSYHMALKLGCDVDQPRNLAKSVTVE